MPILTHFHTNITSIFFTEYTVFAVKVIFNCHTLSDFDQGIGADFDDLPDCLMPRDKGQCCDNFCRFVPLPKIYVRATNGHCFHFDLCLIAGWLIDWIVLFELITDSFIKLNQGPVSTVFVKSLGAPKTDLKETKWSESTGGGGSF